MILNPLQAVSLYGQFFAVALMTGVIWTVQLIVYPQFLWIEPERFRAFHESYTSRISLIVVPLMFLQLATACVGAIVFRDSPDRVPMLINASLTLLAWAITFTVHVPLHNRLADGFSEETIRTLVRTNWIRTAIWTAHLALMIWQIWLLPHLRPPSLLTPPP